VVPTVVPTVSNTVVPTVVPTVSNTVVPTVVPTERGDVFTNYTPTKCTIFSLHILYSSTPTHVSAFTRPSSGGS
jgi:hypothetical protein